MSGFLRKIGQLFSNTNNEQTEKPVSFDSSYQIQNPSSISISVAQQYFYQEMFPPEHKEKPISTPQKLVVQALQDTIKDPEHLMKSIPRLPSVIPRLLRTLHDEKASAKDFVAIVKKDPSMSAGILKLVNTTYFNPTDNRITDIEVAVIKLGIDGLRRVLSAVVLQPVIQAKTSHFSQFGKKLWRHSLSCAVACELMAKKSQLEPYHAYLLGLTHDLGKITLFSELCSQLEQNAPDEAPSRKLMIPLMKSWSQKVSFSIAKNWQLPDEICQALKQQVDLKAGNKVNIYGKLLFQANIVCEAYCAQQQNKDEFKYVDRRLTEEWQLPEDLFSTVKDLVVEL